MLVFAGVDTTRNQLGLGMSVFLQHPKQWQLLAERPELAPRAAEEVMRIRPTITWVTREAVEDFVLRRRADREGHHHPPAVGVRPAPIRASATTKTFDIAADNERHFGFGGGVHHCLGHFVARSDMTIAFRALSQRIKARASRRHRPNGWPTAATPAPSSCRSNSRRPRPSWKPR